LHVYPATFSDSVIIFQEMPKRSIEAFD